MSTQQAGTWVPTTINLLNRSPFTPTLELKWDSAETTEHAFHIAAYEREPGVAEWQTSFEIPQNQPFSFRIRLNKNLYITPFGESADEWYQTNQTSIWVLDGQIFDYKPSLTYSPSKIIKIAEFEGSLPTRPLYIYLPRGYAEHAHLHYPTIYMQDGQNCFERFVSDSFAGTWRADQVADHLIAHGKMEECIIVAVGHGDSQRIAEYLPPYITFNPLKSSKDLVKKRIPGRAHKTYNYYADEVAPYIREQFRVKSGRDHTAMVGSSMGGLFTVYVAWEHPQFARHHAALSTSFWITEVSDHGDNHLELIERLRTKAPSDIRLWLDSGTLSAENYGNDGMYDTIAARDALLSNGFTLGDNLHYYLDQGATHSEASWAGRLNKIFTFLFPLKSDSC